MTKWVYTFGDGVAEGDASMKNLLGGKGANLAEMSRVGVPVPPGFTITTEVCTYYYANNHSYPAELKDQVLAALQGIESKMGSKFGDPKNPLLFSVRSGARVSMPGMMDTVLNLGLNDETVIGLAERSGNAKFAYAVKIINHIEERIARDKYMNTSELNAILRDEIARLMEESHSSQQDFGLEVKEGTPYVMMVVGVNGAGKTTTIGKLAAKLTAAGRKVYIGAADTFRAAAIDQLAVWAERAGATMIRQEMGSDPASVAYDTLKSAVANGADVVLIDTAGRLHNKVGLMNELTKIRNVMAKVIPDAPHEVMLVLDGSTGQNAFEQARQFTQATQVTSLTITKLDGTAKGGVVIGISDQFHIPVRYIGIGEGIDQLRMFNRHDFVNALFGEAK